MHHHLPNIFKEMRRVGVFFCIAIGMVHPVHHRICFWNKKRGSLKKPSQEIESFFPKRVSEIHLVRCISVKKKRMKKQR
jgi:hypothetical protein